MKKIISWILTLFFLFSPSVLNANGSIVVSAVVWNINQSPIILSVNPDWDPWILQTNEVQNYSIYFKDTENDKIYYTITPWNNSWYVNPISWVINTTDYDNNDWAYINFLYLAPAIAKYDAVVTVTLNDWPNITSKQLNLYIY